MKYKASLIIPILGLAILGSYFLYTWQLSSQTSVGGTTTATTSQSSHDSEVIDLGLPKIALDTPNKIQWWNNSVIYEIWLRSFSDHNEDGTGDLLGVVDKLDYLKDLGVSAVWLSPIHPSPSYHGYEVLDHYRIDPIFGSEQDFEKLIEEANKRNIRVIMDLVVNHVSDQHLWFKAALNKDEEYSDYFVWKTSIPAAAGKPWQEESDENFVWHINRSRNDYYYGAFGFASPDLNFHNIAVQDEVIKIAEFWAAKGVSGFRIDGARYLFEDGGSAPSADLPETIAYWKKFSKALREHHPDIFLIGEIFSDSDIAANYYADGNAFSSVFDFDLANLINSILTPNEGNSQVDSTQLATSVRNALWSHLKLKENNKSVPDYFFTNFIGNHDLDRPSINFNDEKLKLKIAASLLLLLPGSTAIYYGEEIGMGQAASGKDIFKRGLMQWNDAELAGFNTSGLNWLDETNHFPWDKDYSQWWAPYWNSISANSENVESQKLDDASILSHYKRLIRLKRELPALAKPESIELLEPNGMIWATKYTHKDSNAWVIINLSSDNTLFMKAPDYLKGKWIDHYSSEKLEIEDSIRLLPGQVITLTKNLPE